MCQAENPRRPAPRPSLDLPPAHDYLALVMPVSLRAPEPSGRTLRRYYQRLRRHFGPQHWWPARTRFEVILGALLTQNASWTNVEKALGNLRRAGVLAPAALRRLSAARLARLLRPTGYFRQKTRYVRSFLGHLERSYRGSLRRMLGRPTPTLRQELLQLPGMGEETVDSILLYAAERPVFVIDTYTRRVLSRHGLASLQAPYGELQSFFERHLPQDPALYNEYHALLVAVGKNYCHRARPDCGACPLGIELEPAHARA